MVPSKKIFCDITKCVACRTCELACAIEHSTTKDLFLAMLERPRPHKRTFVHLCERNVSHSIACQHCEDAPCIEACMSSCISKNEKAGKVDIDRSRCVACWMCIMVCPFGIISREISDKPSPFMKELGKNNKAIKCDLCPDREVPACVDSCPSKALSFETRKEFLKRLEEKIKVYEPRTF